MTDPIKALTAINARQADDGDADLLALLTADATSLVIASPDRTEVISYLDAAGAKHSIESVVRP